MATISQQTASQLQSDIMKVAHTLKSGAYVDSSAIKQAADVVAKRNGYKSGLELQRMIGSRTQILKKMRSPIQQQDTGKASPDLINRFIQLIKDRDGIVPLDWILLREWTDVSATELRHARKAVIASGYKQTKTKNGHYVFALPVLPEPATNGIDKSTEVIQGVLLEAESNTALEKLVLELQESQKAILFELRQIKGLMAKMVGVWSK